MSGILRETWLDAFRRDRLPDPDSMGKRDRKKFRNFMLQAVREQEGHEQRVRDAARKNLAQGFESSGSPVDNSTWREALIVTAPTGVLELYLNARDGGFSASPMLFNNITEAISFSRQVKGNEELYGIVEAAINAHQNGTTRLSWEEVNPDARLAAENARAAEMMELETFGVMV